MTTCPKCQRLQCDEVWVADSPTTQHFDRFECKDCGPIPVTVHLHGKRPTEQSTTEDRDSLKAKLAQVEADAAVMREALNKPDELLTRLRALECGSGQALLDELAQLRATAARRLELLKPFDSPTGPIVLAFAVEMERKLAKNRHKGDRKGWMKDGAHSLLNRIHDEWEELRAKLDNGSTSSEIVQECADVANFALMVADRVGALPYCPLAKELEDKP